MCDICLQYPCHPRCPNYQPKIKCCCDECGEEIYKGEEYWTDDGGYIYCSEECAEKHNGIMSKEDDYYDDEYF